MFDALVDTLMALWNASWREKAVPTLFAFLAVSISTFLFLMQVGLPDLSRLSSASSHSSLQGQAGRRSVSLAINRHVTASVQAIAVPTPAQTGGDTKILPTPIPAPPTQDTTYPPAPMPVQLPGIVSQPDSSAYTGTTDIVSTDTIPAKSRIHTPTRHSAPPTTVASVPTIVATTVAPMATPTGSTITSTPSSAPTIVVTPTPPPTTVTGAMPTVVVPTNAPTPTASVYLPTPISESTPANAVTVSPAIVPTDTGRLQATAAVSPTASY